LSDSLVFAFWLASSSFSSLKPKLCIFSLPITANRAVAPSYLSSFERSPFKKLLIGKIKNFNHQVIDLDQV
jgi:hypothetical protein